ncbi:unnamed protein product [Schistosoma mattheei]|uniref:Uncharacterized protein n=1 Tax=Schistosoma mattheei TaxID=31246 RepID=A0A3P8HDC6_9TREM|nr:unnamed protein product [Schistosoma mattheei]
MVLIDIEKHLMVYTIHALTLNSLQQVHDQYSLEQSHHYDSIQVGWNSK